MLPFIIFFALLKSIILCPFKKKYKIIITPLFSIINYANNGVPDNVLISLRNLKRAFLFLKSASKNKPLGNEKIHPIAIFNDTLVDSLISEKYIDSINVSKPSLSFNRLDLQIDNYFIKLSSYFLCIVLFLLIFPITLFSREKRATISIIIYCFCTWVALCHNLKKIKCNYIYYFSSYASDANMISYLLNENNIKVHKVPYNVPLIFFYKYLLCDVFSTTTPFHIEQIKSLKKNWLVGKIIQWPLLNFQDCKPFINTGKSSYSSRLGFISSGTYIRNKSGHVEVSETYKNELRLINFLKKHLENNDIDLLIMLHPFEKINQAVYDASCNYYKDLIGTSRIKFSNINANSMEYFSETETCITGISQLAIYRLFCGYKTLIAPFEYENGRYFGEKSIESITLYSELELSEALKNSYRLSENEFFSRYKLHKYHFKSIDHYFFKNAD